MVVLKNITSFRDFIFEASIPSEFSNETGFSQSLVGRGIFSLLRYIKQGVDYMRLEYLKRKLENEYFAGWLRYCALKQVDLKEGTMPEQSKKEEEVGGEEFAGNNKPVEQGDDEAKYCNIFNSTKNEIAALKTDLEIAKKDLDEIIADTNNTPEEIADFNSNLALINSGLTCCKLKTDVNLQAFDPLRNLVTATGLTFDDNNRDLIIQYLDKIILFVKEALTYCKKYMFMDDEKTLLKTLKTCTNPDILTKIAELNAIFTATPVLDNYQYVNEAITSGINKSIPISQMLGDVLSTDEVPLKANPYEYLKKMGISRIEDINFPKINDLWKRENLRDEATKLVNVDGIKKIQYAASRYIYRIKKTPTYTGITPEKGGGVSEEDSALRTAWEKKVEKVRSEWTNFLNVDTVDPFKLITLQEAYRKNTTDYKSSYDDVNKTTNEIVALSKWDKIGLVLKGSASSVTDGDNFIVECFVKGVKYNIILNMHKSINPAGGESIKTFRYVGNVDIDKIIKDEIWVKDPGGFQNTLKDYVSEISNPTTYISNNFNDINTAFNFDVTNPTATIAGHYKLHGIYFITPQCDIITVTKSDTDKAFAANIKIIYFYTDKTNGVLKEYSVGGTATTTNFKIRSYKDGTLNPSLATDLNVGAITDSNYIKFGRLALIKTSFKSHYFPTHKITVEPINGDEAGKFITFKK